MRLFRTIVFSVLFAGASTQGLASESSDQAPWKIINYWSITCAPCRVEIPELNYLSEELMPFNVTVLGVNFDEDPREKTLQIAERMGIKFPTLTLAKVEALHLTAPSVLPTTYILSPDNEVKAKMIGAQDRDTIKQKLAELFASSKYPKSQPKDS